MGLVNRFIYRTSEYAGEQISVIIITLNHLAYRKKKTISLSVNIINYLLVKILLPLHGKGKALFGLCHYTVYLSKSFDYIFFLQLAMTLLNKNVFPR